MDNDEFINALKQKNHKKILELAHKNNTYTCFLEDTLNKIKQCQNVKYYECIQDIVDNLLIDYSKNTNQIDCLKLIISIGANINTKDNGGNTALIWASVNDNIQGVEELLKKPEIDINFQNSFGYTALMYASSQNYKDIVELLLNNNADPDIQNNFKDTALLEASSNGHKDIVELLLKKGADTNIQNGHGNTALMEASNNRHEDIVELLKQYGAK